MQTNTEQQAVPVKVFRKLAEERRERIIRKKELLEMIGLSDATIWRMEKKGDFPIRLQLGGNSCGWLESEIYAWLNLRANAREV